MLSVKPVSQPFARNRLLRDASWQAVYDAMKADPSVHVFGEGCEVKAHYDAPDMLREFPDRIVTMPISEDGNTNFAVGASLLGIKPVVDIISADFLYRAMDSICNTAAKLALVRSEPSTIVIRAEFLLGGPTTGQRPEALLAHIPGLRVVIPSTPRDAYGLMCTALETPGVTLYFEDRMIDDKGLDDVAEYFEVDHTRVPFGMASYRRMGQRGTATIVTYGLMRQRVEVILKDWGKGDPYREPNLDCGLVDLRSIYPIDWTTIRAALARSGQLLIVEPDVEYGGVGAEIVARIAEEMPHIRVRRLGARRQTAPAAMGLHKYMLPTEEEIVAAIRSLTDWN